jgi:hypothetical protein
MSRTLAEIDLTKPLYLTNARHQLDRPVLEFVEGSDRIRLTAEEGAMFLGWVTQTRWRPMIEADLQCHSQDGRTGEPFITAEIPLVTFREHLCAGGRHLQDAPTAELFDKLRALTRSWRDSGGDTVTMDGYLHSQQQCMSDERA